MKTMIFYFSGTGNSLTVAKSITKELRNSVLQPITRQPYEFIATEYDRIGIVIPVYYLHVPEVVLKCLKDMDISNIQHLFFILTGAGAKGYAMKELRELFSTTKQMKIQEFHVRMPGNYIIEYGAFPNWFQKFLLKKAEKKIKYIATLIREGKSTKERNPGIVSRLSNRKALIKIAKFQNMDENYEINDDCTQCGLCVKLCPVSNISMENNNIRFLHQCAQCMSCIQYCPNKAINYKNKTEGRKRYRNPKINASNILELRNPN